MRAVAVLVVATSAACGVRAPAPVDTAALIAQRGEVEAHRDLEIRILGEPRDIQARLALAELDERLGRPSEAIEQLETVDHLGGPLGTRWHDADRERYARLLVHRADVRLARGAASALADYEHAQKLGAAVTPAALAHARTAAATARLRHVDAEERARARKQLGKPLATADERGRFGAWAWSVGARREGYEQLAAWHQAAPAPHEPALETAYLRALAWWTPPEAAPPAGVDGAARCWFASAGCAPPAEPSKPLELAPPANADPHAWAAARYARARADAKPDELYAIARAFARDPAIAERLGRELVARSPDAAAAHAAVGAMFDALGDPGRARASWQAAVDLSAEPAFWWGLAEATARTGDGSAALIFATTAAAAWGDPAVVWAGVAYALEDRGHHVDALAAVGPALELGDVESLPGALETAIAASRALGRTTQVAALEGRLAHFAPPPPEVSEALSAIRALPNGATLARAWVVSRDRPRDAAIRATMLAALPVDDPRRATLVDELIALAGDADAQVGLAAVRAL